MKTFENIINNIKDFKIYSYKNEIGDYCNFLPRWVITYFWKKKLLVEIIEWNKTSWNIEYFSQSKWLDKMTIEDFFEEWKQYDIWWTDDLLRTNIKKD